MIGGRSACCAVAIEWMCWVGTRWSNGLKYNPVIKHGKCYTRDISTCAHLSVSTCIADDVAIQNQRHAYIGCCISSFGPDHLAFGRNASKLTIFTSTLGDTADRYAISRPKIMYIP